MEADAGLRSTYEDLVRRSLYEVLGLNREFLHTCLMAAKGMKQLIDGFLDLAVIESGHLRRRIAMNLPYLIETAKRLCQPSAAAAAAEFEAARDSLAEALNRRMSARPDVEILISPGNRAMMEDNKRNFCRFMGSMFLAYEPEGQP